MVKITKEQVDYLIKNGYLKSFRGNYPDLTICSRNKKAKRKNRYVSDDVAKFLPKTKNTK